MRRVPCFGAPWLVQPCPALGQFTAVGKLFAPSREGAMAAEVQLDFSAEVDARIKKLADVRIALPAVSLSSCTNAALSPLPSDALYCLASCCLYQTRA